MNWVYIQCVTSNSVPYPALKNVKPYFLTPLLASPLANLTKANTSPLLQQHHLPRLDEIACLEAPFYEGYGQLFRLTLTSQNSFSELRGI